jgi:hypothetical protein
MQKQKSPYISNHLETWGHFKEALMIGTIVFWVLLLPPVNGGGTIENWERVGKFEKREQCEAFQAKGLEERTSRGFTVEADRFRDGVCAQFEKK